MVEFGSKRIFPTEVVVKSNLMSTSGRVYMKDEFDDSTTLDWKYDGSSGGTAAIQSVEKYSGSGALKLTPPSGTSKHAGCSRQIPTPKTKKVGFECVFGMQYQFDGWISWELSWNDGTAGTSAAVKYDHATGKWYIASLSAYPYWVEVPDSSMVLTDYEKSFIRVKFVVDMVTKMFTSLVIQDMFFDLSSYPCNTGSYTSARQIFLRIINSMGVSNTDYHVYIDSLIITEE